MSIKFGQYLRQIRESKGGKGFWSLSTVAARANISHSYLSQLETGQVEQPLPNILKKLAEALRHPYEDLMRAAGYLPPEIKIKYPEIPVVCRVSAGKKDKVILVHEPIEPPEYISFKNCKAVIVDSDSMAPIALKGQKIIYCEDESIHDGDLVYCKLKSGDSYFKRYFKDKKNHLITLQSINPNEPYPPISIKEEETEFIYKVVGMKF